MSECDSLASILQYFSTWQQRDKTLFWLLVVSLWNAHFKWNYYASEQSLEHSVGIKKCTFPFPTSMTLPLINGWGKKAEQNIRLRKQVDYFSSPHLSLKHTTVKADMLNNQLMDGWTVRQRWDESIMSKIHFERAEVHHCKGSRYFERVRCGT